MSKDIVTLKFVEDVKELMSTKRDALISEKLALEKRFQKGCEFFLSTKQRSKQEMENASKSMKEIIQNMQRVERDLYDLDVIIGTKLESFLSDTEIRVQTARAVDETGDKNIPQNPLIYFDDSEKVTITPEDLWALKILKPALHYKNIHIKKKGE